MTEQTSINRYIIYIGNFLEEEIVRERGLPTFNIAGSNRMYRMASALRTAGQRVILISPAASMAIGWKGKILHRDRLCRFKRVPVYYCAAAGIFGANAILEPLFILTAIIKLRKTICIEKVIIYNFSPSLLLVSGILRYLWGIRFINNVEDVSRPKLSDWLSSTEVRPLQQIIFSVCMDVIAKLSDGVVVPTKRFLRDLPAQKNALVISGCMPSHLNTISPAQTDCSLNILFSGKIEFEHGIHFFIEALRQLDRAEDKSIQRSVCINICGHGPQSRWLSDQLKRIHHLRIVSHGFVDSSAYRKLLAAADVCVALQNPEGRDANYKTPSKVYEYLGSGKLVVATAVGDLSELPAEIIEICHGDVSSSLAEILKRLTQQRHSIESRKTCAAQYSEQHFSYPIVGQRLKEFMLSSNV